MFRGQQYVCPCCHSSRVRITRKHGVCVCTTSIVLVKPQQPQASSFRSAFFSPLFADRIFGVWLCCFDVCTYMYAGHFLLYGYYFDTRIYVYVCQPSFHLLVIVLTDVCTYMYANHLFAYYFDIHCTYVVYTFT